MTDATPPAPSACRQDDPDQVRRLQAYLVRHPDVGFSLAQGEQRGFQVTVGRNRIIIHYSLTKLLDKLEDAERAAIGTTREAAETCGEAR